MWDLDNVNAAAIGHGFERRRGRNWVRRTPDFVQVVNIQSSSWSEDENYLNLGLWALALGDPPSMAHNKLHFSARAEDLGARDIASFFSRLDELSSLESFRERKAAGHVAGLLSSDLRRLLDGH